MKALHLAAYNADPEQIERHLRAGESVDGRDDSGYTALLWSCFRGIVGDQRPVARALIAAGADPNAITREGDANCLILAAQSGNAALLEMLVRAGADVNVAVGDVTPLMEAARSGDEGLVDVLISLGSDKAAIWNGFCAADYARYQGHDELAARLSFHAS
jgi:uncharacterized protein